MQPSKAKRPPKPAVGTSQQRRAGGRPGSPSPAGAAGAKRPPEAGKKASPPKKKNPQSMERRRQAAQTKARQRKPQEPTERNLRRQKIKRKRRLRAYAVLLVLLLGVGVYFAFQTLLRINDFVVEGECRYTPDELIAATGLELDQHLYDFEPEEAEARLLEKFVYLENVKVSRRLPATVVIQVEAAQEMGSIQGQNGFDIVSTSGKILAYGQPYPSSDLPIIYGIEATQEQFVPKEETDKERQAREAKARDLQEKLSILAQMNQLFNQYHVQGIVSIDLSDRQNISLVYQERIRVVLGDAEDMELKFRMCDEVIKQKDVDEPGAEGVLDASTVAVTQKVFFRTQSIHTTLTTEPEDPEPDEDNPESSASPSVGQ